MDPEIYEKYGSHCGYLEKKKNFFVTQNRFFRIVNGKTIVYSDNETSEPKGFIEIEQIIKIDSLKGGNFKFEYPGRTFELTAPNEKDKFTWITAITELKNEIFKIKNGDYVNEAEMEVIQKRNRSNTGQKNWKANKIDKNIMEEMKQAGIGPMKYKQETELSENCLEVKNIKNHLNMDDPNIKSNVCYGFMYKKKEALIDSNQRRWLFLISSRPLVDDQYELKDTTLDQSVLPYWLKFDTLYYYTFDNNTDNSEPRGIIEIKDSHGIDISDEDDKFVLKLDMGTRIYLFNTEYKYEREKWCEALKNCRRTLKEIKNSISQRPKNVAFLIKAYEKDGEEKIQEIAKKKKDEHIKLFDQINDFETLEIVLNNLKNELIYTIDGCMVQKNPQTEIAKIFAKIFNNSVLYLVQEFWKEHYQNLQSENIIDLSWKLKEYDDIVSKYGVNDANFSKNSEELVKIFIKKTYLNVRVIIENILQTERKEKVDHLSYEYITIGPSQLFNVISEIFNLIKSRKIKVIFEQMIELTKECIIQYLIGVDILIKKTNLLIGNDFLIAVSNNSDILINNLNNLIENILSNEILTEEEIRNFISKKKILSVITMLNNYSIFRFVNENSEKIIENIDEQFMDIDIKKVIIEANKVFHEFEPRMYMSTKTKLWIEVLRTICFYYMRRIIFSKKKVKKIGELTGKINSDINFLKEVFLEKIGENTIKQNLIPLEKLLEFFETPADMISFSISSLREHIGPTFQMEMARSMIEWRVDFSSAEKKSCIQTCKEVLENYKGEENDNVNKNPLVEYIILERKNMAKRVSCSHGLESVEEMENNDRKIENIRRGTMNISDFLGQMGEIPDGVGEDNKEVNFESEKRTSVTDKVTSLILNSKKKEEIVDADVIISGMMEKKSNAKVWQTRFFQLKNGYLFWYKNKESSECLNKIDVREMKKVQATKSQKFIISFGDKIYKFKNETDEERNNWVKFLNIEIKNINGSDEKTYEGVIEIKMKKKVIEDYFNLPKIQEGKDYIIRLTEESIAREGYFPPKPKKEKKQRKEEIPIVQEELSKSLSTSFSESPMKSDADIKRFSIEETPQTNNSNSSIFECFSNCFGLCKKRKKSSLLETN